MAKKKYYVDSKKLERVWTKWLQDGNESSWDELLDGVYKICQGVAVHFRPADEEEHKDLSHEAFVLAISKIKDGRLKFEPGRAPVFNLLTTTIFRHLYSMKNKDSRRRVVMTKFRDEMVAKGAYQTM